MSDPLALPAGVQVFERGWLSANNILLCDAHEAVLVDSGYVTHSAQTLALLTGALGSRPLDRLLNTHLHSDHCGGNAALQAHYPALQTWIPPGLSEAVRHWQREAMSHDATGQSCPPFRFDQLLRPGQTLRLGPLDWEVHAAPGHDPDSVLLFAPAARLMISADALWEHGFGVVFPELLQEPAFDAVASTLDLIERLAPQVIIPGHGRVFADTAGALQRARSKLERFVQAPDRHAAHGAKVLLVFKLLEWQQVPQAQMRQWATSVPYLRQLHARLGGGQPLDDWLQSLLAELQHSGALVQDADWVRAA
jgi:glyoxylase-like metal-dependent hydrolase (beta-lactamase superfamily II)